MFVYFAPIHVYTNVAMQGAFAEHQVMLQKVHFERPITIILVRQAEDLARCDALIIPGGGKSISLLIEYALISFKLHQNQQRLLF